MIPRLGLDLEPGIHIMRELHDLDLLDVAYGATHGGAETILAPLSLFTVTGAYTPDLFSRPGLPLLAAKVESRDLDRVPSLGGAIDRIVVTGEGNRILPNPGEAAQYARQVAGAGQEVGVFAEPSGAALKELSRARIQWVFFSTEAIFRATQAQEAQDEIAKLSSAALAASRINLRVALWGPTGRHLPTALAAISGVEEIYPVPDLWSMALRLGWERAVSEYRILMR